MGIDLTTCIVHTIHTYITFDRLAGQFNSMVDQSFIGMFNDPVFTKKKACGIVDKEEESVIGMLTQILRYKPEKAASPQRSSCLIHGSQIMVLEAMGELWIM